MMRPGGGTFVSRAADWLVLSVGIVAALLGLLALGELLWMRAQAGR